MRVLRCGVVVAGLIFIAGCQTLQQPRTESVIDEEITTKPAPSTPPPEVTDDQPRSGFEQEPPKSQEP